MTDIEQEVKLKTRIRKLILTNQSKNGTLWIKNFKSKIKFNDLINQKTNFLTERLRHDKFQNKNKSSK